jgi:hypothetical protein
MNPNHIKVYVQGIPCLASVTHFKKQPAFSGPANACESDEDYFGFIECEFEILDRNGRPAAWLVRKLTDRDVKSIERAIASSMANNDD